MAIRMVAKPVTTVVIGASDHSLRNQIPAAIRAGMVILAIADHDPERAERAVEFVQQVTGLKPKACRTHTKAFAVGADSAIIVTPTPTHARLAVAALRRGMHVFLEKPAAANVRGVKRMIAVAREIGCGITVGFQKRVAVRGPLQAVRDGRIGHVMTIKATWNRKWVELSPPFYMDPVTGGVILDFVHLIDLVLQFIEGRPVSATMVGRSDRGRARKGRTFKAEAKATGMLLFEDRVVPVDAIQPLVVLLDLDWASHQPHEYAGLRIEATGGQLHVQLPTDHETTLGLAAVLEQEGEQVMRFDPPPTNLECHEILMAEFADACAGEGEFSSDADLLTTQWVVDRLRRSARNRGRTQLFVSL